MTPAEAADWLPLAYSIAWKAIHRAPAWADAEDIRQEAVIGLLEAAAKYDPDRGRFDTYATHRIEGQIRDYMRRIDHLTRHQRAAADPDDPATLAPTYYEGFTSTGSLDATSSALITDPSAEVEAVLADRAALAAFATWIRQTATNPDPLLIVLAMRLDGFTLQHVGWVLNVSESRVSQIEATVHAHARTFGRLLLTEGAA